MEFLNASFDMQLFMLALSWDIIKVFWFQVSGSKIDGFDICIRGRILTNIPTGEGVEHLAETSI